MQEVAILIDSIACIPDELVRRYNLRILPLNLVINGKSYRDGVNLSVKEAYRHLEESPDGFFSSPASTGEYLEVFLQAGRETRNILCVTLSAKLSAMYSVACTAMRQALEENPGLSIVVLDSKNAAVGEGLVISAAARAAGEGRSLQEVVRFAEMVASRVKLIGIMDTVRYFYRTGRVPKLASRFGSMLNIRPVFTVREGLVKSMGIIKDREHGIRRILQNMDRDVGDKPVHAAVAHADALEAGRELLQTIQSRYNCIETWLTDFSPVMAYATGKGVLAVAYYTDN